MDVSSLPERTRVESASVAEVRGDRFEGGLDSQHTELNDPPPSRHYGVGIYFSEESLTLKQIGAAVRSAGNRTNDIQGGSI